MKLAEALHTLIDELRMQMLGVQVLFGFEFQCLFQERFDSQSATSAIVHGSGLALLVLASTLLLTPACQHRIVERGNASFTLFATAKYCANAALVLIAAALGCVVFVALDLNTVRRLSALAAGCVTATAVLIWFLLGLLLRTRRTRTGARLEESDVSLHEKITQMLTEARVVLPGAQALLGFQLVVMMSETFAKLPSVTRSVHMIALGGLCLCIILLISPAALHRIGFGGEDDPRFHRLGSVLVAAALLPLAVSMSLDMWIALGMLYRNDTFSLLGAGAAFLVLIGFWYALPFAMRGTRRSLERTYVRVGRFLRREQIMGD